MNYLWNNVLLPIAINIMSPIILFLLASLIMKNNTISKLISRIYMSVKRGLEINTEEVVDAGEVSDLTTPSTNELSIIKSENIDYKESEILKKLSKDYGADSKTGWEVRTFYTLAKKQLFENKIINFQVKGNKFNIYLKTDDLIKYFDLKNEQEVVSDGVGKIRVYIFQKTNDKNEKEYYLVRFGRKALENPVQLKYS
ncbi:hypothetical protein MKG59_002245 [Enterococcus faecalis]|jgi:hypothetical protein|nr:hypothetical protein [Enterococcus faecalis]